MLENLENMNELNESGIATLEKEIGKDKVEGIRDEIQRLIANGTMDKTTIPETAERFGVPQKIVELITNYYQNL